MGGDASSEFTSEFYKNMKILSQDLYRRSSSNVANTGDDVAAMRRALRRKSDSGGSQSRLLRRQSSGKIKRTPSDNSDTGANSAAPSPNIQLENVGNIVAESFDMGSITQRLKQYAAMGDLPLEFIHRYAGEGGQPSADKANDITTTTSTSGLPTTQEGAEESSPRPSSLFEQMAASNKNDTRTDTDTDEDSN